MDVIGMVKAGNQRYLFEGKRLTLKELYHAATPVGTLNKSILRYVRAELVPGIPIMMIGHTTIVFSRYILLAWQHRLSTDQRTLGGLFLALCDEVAVLDWAVALNQLVEIINKVVEKANQRISKLIRRQLQEWMSGLPSYIKVYLSISV